MLSSAYGILVSMENMGFTIGPLLVALMLNEALIGAGFAAYVFYFDITHSRVLIANSKKAVAIQKAEHAKHKAEIKAVQAPVITGL